ncbi:MAG: hypothetical protein LBB88_03745 [Planctomycetaceae bacterium]|jgi:hypothetical protein|nr:hypothetical protein [Planctomycetaceae bacterium]
MNLKQLVNKAKNKNNFADIKAYVNFSGEYLKYIADNLQAIIVSQNENHYQFFQYNKEGNYQITRPINSILMYDSKNFKHTSNEFIKILHNIKTIDKNNQTIRNILNNVTYTIQQTIGAALDGLPAGYSNTARKLNGDLFEHFIRLIIREIGIDCTSGVVQIPVVVDGKIELYMKYQHDLIVKNDDTIKLIGSIKTSSKDRLDKIFIDKFLYHKLTETTTPHIAIFLNDVQRKNNKHKNKYGVKATFLPGHFKAYTIKLNPLDGVYYCDIRPNMLNENVLKNHIKTFDHLLIDDFWKFT